jgi:hypothetical protein
MTPSLLVESLRFSNGFIRIGENYFFCCRSMSVRSRRVRRSNVGMPARAIIPEEMRSQSIGFIPLHAS